MAEQHRQFIVRDKSTGIVKSVTGKCELSKELGVAARLLPDVFIFKVVYGKKIVTEVIPQ